MGAWGLGTFGNDDAADWAGDFDEAAAADRDEVVRAALAEAVTDDYLDATVAAAALAAAAVVASLLPGGTPVDEVYGPKTLGEQDLDASTPVRELAVAALTAVKGEDSEWLELWEESDEAEAAVELVDGLITVLRP